MSQASEVKDDRQYTKDHEWALTQGDEIVIGITAFAVDQLGDVTLVNIDVKPGDTIEAGKPFGTIESVKTLSDLFAPVDGTVVQVNPELENTPELVNEDPWTRAWMIRVKPKGPVLGLLDAEGYEKHLSASAH